ncbi:MAG: tRNA U-34 5-methylaminomethyl-2-thiouridine biosynthesis protein [Candidatus Thermoplasmatota archaeon]|nr:tRNA U-34 5-methylaminomethyl-2-thiouridine biosynthesis protein [Candidatus Thermoplasmatota archaeon]
MAQGEIVAGCLAPHPPHLVYAENPEQNEPVAEGGWEQLRWGYERLRESLSEVEYDAIVILSPHWQTYVGTHFLGLEHFQSLSVDPIFPNLFRYHYDMNVDVELAQQIHDKALNAGLAVKMMTNPDFRVDYGTITTGHMFRPQWDKPLVVISSNRSRAYYSVEVMQEMMMELGRVTREAILESGKKVVVLASNSLSHRHFTTESEIPEDMSKEHITSHAMHLWDMRIIDYMKSGQCQRIIDEMPEFTEQAIAETDGGAFTWLLATLEVPSYPAILHGYGTIIGTGNAIVEWPVYKHKEV